jgi:hypothetical protein
MPKPLTSCARRSLSTSTAHLVAQQKPISGIAAIPRLLETPSMCLLTCCRSKGSAA